MSVQGMTCAACAARVKKKLNTIDGVAATVNFATEAAIVTAPAEVPVQRLIDAVEQAGYRAEILDRSGGGTPGAGPQEPAERGGDADVVADLRRRLIVALVLFIPLTDLSVLLSLFPWSRFPGWQWVLIAVAAPVVLWSAWPFHAAALRNARHGSSSMDTREQVKRSHTVRFDLSEEEFAGAGAAAERAGLAKGAYAAQAALIAARSGTSPGESPLRDALGEFIRAAGLVRRIVVNLNHAVAKLNATGQRSVDLLPYAAEGIRRARLLDQAAEEVRRSPRATGRRRPGWRWPSS